jgi:hypothetical protein
VDNQDLVTIMKSLHHSAFKLNVFTESIRIADTLINQDPEELMQHLECTCKSLHLYGDFTNDSEIPTHFLSSIFMFLFMKSYPMSANALAIFIKEISLGRN